MADAELTSARGCGADDGMTQAQCEKCINLGYHDLRWVGKRANGKNGCQIIKTAAPTTFPTA